MNEKTTLIFASGNRGKLHEVQCALTQFRCLPQDHIAIPPVIETGDTFLANALLKAQNACTHTDHPVLADDSGINR